MKQGAIIWTTMLTLLGACQQTEKDQLLTLKGYFADSSGKPIVNMRFLLIEEKTNNRFNPFAPNDIIAQHVLRSDSGGRFSYQAQWHSGVFFTLSSSPDSIAPYYIVGCSTEAQGNTCRISPHFPTTVALTVQRFH
ncbi:hypothetical protein [Spirosoma pollinicola]|uniref:Uncharacterized protein n=1 Tax=Spirosoma pollinicola TaxID=2057025 RepID=A0A2K8Z2K1_9BACT|nr:hypothetical protein [Spirosoma pollinicola]AUD04110.1 hypothetical protein CWM47_21115 [Spirosoma pollinicola]